MLLDDIIAAYRQMGVREGDVIEVSSDVRALVTQMRHEAKNRGEKPQPIPCYLGEIIESLKEMVGGEGTLLFPTYSWGFCRGEAWDYNKTLGETGALSNHALSLPEFRRTRHPIYSFAVWGKDQEYLVNLDHADSFGVGSPFAYLHQKGHLNISLGAPSFFTFTHYVEQCNHVAYRFKKEFTAPYTMDGVTTSKTYSMTVRRLEPREALSIAAESSDLLDGKGLVKEYVSGIILQAIDFRAAYETISWDIAHNNAAHIMRWA